MNKIIKRITTMALAIGLTVSMAGCSDASTASHNLSNDSDNFKIARKVVFFNGITDKYLLTIEGFCSITKDNNDNQLEVTCKTGDDEYKKHYLGLSDNVTYFVEQVNSARISTNYYKVVFKPTNVVPDIEVR
jgi:uncharacterized lipoprotein YehR (DUF1307 family)